MNITRAWTTGPGDELASQLAAVQWRPHAVRRNVASSDLVSSGVRKATKRCCVWKCSGVTDAGTCCFLTPQSTTLQEIEMRPHKPAEGYRSPHRQPILYNHRRPCSNNCR